MKQVAINNTDLQMKENSEPMQHFGCSKCQPEKEVMKTVILFVAILVVSGACKKRPLCDIRVTRTSTELIIQNNSSKQIYYTSFGARLLPLIDWAPFCRENTIAPNSNFKKDLRDVSGYTDADKLMVYFWECSNNTPGEIKTIVLGSNETNCAGLR